LISPLKHIPKKKEANPANSKAWLSGWQRSCNSLPIQNVSVNEFKQRIIPLQKPLDIHREAAKGVQGIGQPLPYFDKLQQVFGGHDISHIKAFMGTEAQTASRCIGAQAYATGRKIAFAESNPSLHTVAHEVIHVLQQQAGVNLQNRLGKEGDCYEQQANAVADRIVQGNSAMELLGAPKENNLKISGIPNHVSSHSDAESGQSTIRPSVPMQTAATVIQREVLRSRERGKTYSQKYYSSYDEHDDGEKKYFINKLSAEAYDNELSRKKVRQGKKQQKKARDKKIEEKRAELEKNFSDYKPPEEVETARVFKDSDKASADVSVTKLDPENAKESFEFFINQRRVGKFDKHVVKVHENYYVLDKGTDIGITPAVLRPDLEKHARGKIPLSRRGKAKPYSDLGSGLDKIVSAYGRGEYIESTRVRVGKDIGRLTRGNETSGDFGYSKDEIDVLTEVAVILRLDKARVPDATGYIHDTFTSGSHSFTDLLTSKEYVGAGTGGVGKLRKQTELNPDQSSQLSEGEKESDREED
jgi:hypothetical protein